MSPTQGHLRFLLLQARGPGDLMAKHEQQCFADALSVPIDAVNTHDLLQGRPSEQRLETVDILLIGGAGDYSVLDTEPFIKEFIAFLADLVQRADIPTFASCFGFQALTLAGGGTVIADPDKAEVGTFDLHLTDQGKNDPLFGTLPPIFKAQLGHKDRADRLPDGMTNLAYSERAPFQACRVQGAPIIATQFHPELCRDTNTERYLRYWDNYGKGNKEDDPVLKSMADSPESSALLARWVREELGDP